jgi:ABC-type transport system involved in multi-copper enzyme maturation permease subunit
MVGPVLYLEMLLGSRRGRQHVFRWIYGGWLLLQLLIFYVGYAVDSDRDAAARFATSFVNTFVVQQFILVLLATPTFTAGAVTDEKSRGTLQYLLTADLTPPEIVIGKLLGRAAQVAVLVLAGLPVLCFVGVFGGVDLIALLGLAAVTALAILAIGAASLLASVWCKQTRDAVLSLYALGGLGYLVVRGVHVLHHAVAAGSTTTGFGPALIGLLHRSLSYFNPLFVLEPAWGQGELKEFACRLLGAILAWGSVGAVCLALAIWRLRGAYLRQLEGAGKKRKAHWWLARQKPVTGDPVRWKERQVEGIAPLAVLRHVPGWLGLLGIFVLTLLSSGAILYLCLPAYATLDKLLDLIGHGDLTGLSRVVADMGPAGDGFMAQGIVVMLVASLVVGIRCSGAVSGERERQTWEALLLTPLETRQLVRGKLKGIMGASYPYLRAYAVPAVLLSMLGGMLAVFWAVVWLAVTWLAMYFVGAAGIWCSVRSKSSWRSLLGTLGWGYLGGFLLYAFTTPAIFILALLIVVVLSIFDEILGLSTAKGFASFFGKWALAFMAASCLALVGIFIGAATYFIRAAEKRVADLERTRYWPREEPISRRRRRRASRPRYYR